MLLDIIARSTRRRTRVTVLAAVLLCLYFFSYSHWRQTSRVSGLDAHSISLANRQTQLWQYLHRKIVEHAPKGPLPKLSRGIGLPRFSAVEEMPRLNYLANADEVLSPMQKAHDGFLKAIQVPFDHAYIPGTKGIVSSAGGHYLPTFVVSLHMLRRTGSQLPVEVFLNEWDEYDPYICEVALPKLNAQCKVLVDMLTADGTESYSGIKSFQIKPIAMVFSSFEEVLWLDADCVPLHDPSILLDSQPFTSTGLVTWPDFWGSTIAPVYFEISRQPDFALTKRPSTESGMLIVSKKTHFLALLLSTYYVFYGPEQYYELFDQGAPGQGDKDAYLCAAGALGLPFYQVSEPVADLGHPASDGGVLGVAMLQADPIEDYQLTSQNKWRVKDPSVARAPRAFFVHTSGCEFNAGEDHMAAKGAKSDGTMGRLWTVDKAGLQRFGYDVEKALWEETTEVGCTLEHAFSSWQGFDGICDKMKAHMAAIFEDSNDETPKFTFDDKGS